MHILDTPILGEYDEMSVAILPASTLLRKNMWVYIYAIQLKIFECLVLEHSKNAHCKKILKYFNCKYLSSFLIFGK
jgi:hypothetical protein